VIFVCIGARTRSFISATKVVFTAFAIFCSEVEFLRFLEDSGIFYSDNNVLFLLTMRLWVFVSWVMMILMTTTTTTGISSSSLLVVFLFLG
jgi:hypothetical protein